MGMTTMKKIIALTLLALAAPCLAQSNVDSTNKYAWTENTGWTNWRDANGGADGVVIGPTFLRGFIWGENVGWINSGNGAGPYSNTDNTNFGVNIGAGGFLNGFAWGENIGWINFDTLAALGAGQAARYDTVAGRFRGYAWGENIGWVNLDDATRFVGGVSCCPGNADKLPGGVTFGDIAFILANFGNTYPNSTGGGDGNCDGAVNFTDVAVTLANFGSSCP